MMRQMVEYIRRKLGDERTQERQYIDALRKGGGDYR